MALTYLKLAKIPRRYFGRISLVFYNLQDNSKQELIKGGGNSYKMVALFSSFEQYIVALCGNYDSCFSWKITEWNTDIKISAPQVA